MPTHSETGKQSSKQQKFKDFVSQITKGNIEEVKATLPDFDLATKNSKGENVFHVLAAHTNHLPGTKKSELFKMFIEALKVLPQNTQYDILNAQTTDTQATPLMLSTQLASKSLVQAFVEAGADPRPAIGVAEAHSPYKLEILLKALKQYHGEGKENTNPAALKSIPEDVEYAGGTAELE